MQLKHFPILILFLTATVCFGQKEKPSALMDTAVYDYDELFSEMDALLDSLYTPRSFGMVNVGIGNGFFQYGTTATAVTKRQLYLSPTVGFFSKSGAGISAGTSLLNYDGGTKPYQFSLTGSYDYLRHRSFITGISYTRYFTQRSLPFYTSPLQSEAYGYFTWRKSWVRPSLAASYGWGTRRSLSQQTSVIEKIKKQQANNGNGNGNNGNGNGGGTTTTTTTVSTYENIADFSLQFSLRHDFYFLKLLSKNDYVRLTPLISLISGSQQFGFNSVSNTLITGKRIGIASVNTTENITLNNGLNFRPLSLTAQFRTEYAYGKFFLQPQLYFDYYFPAQTNHFNTTFLVNAGMIF